MIFNCRKMRFFYSLSLLHNCNEVSQNPKKGSDKWLLLSQIISISSPNLIDICIYFLHPSGVGSAALSQEYTHQPLEILDFPSLAIKHLSWTAMFLVPSIAVMAVDQGNQDFVWVSCVLNQVCPYNITLDSSWGWIEQKNSLFLDVLMVRSGTVNEGRKSCSFMIEAQ